MCALAQKAKVPGSRIIVEFELGDKDEYNDSEMWRLLLVGKRCLPALPGLLNYNLA